jgi:hypothetical protein
MKEMNLLTKTGVSLSPNAFLKRLGAIVSNEAGLNLRDTSGNQAANTPSNFWFLK